MWMPGTISNGVRVPNQVSTIDILPTIIDLLGIKLSEQVQGTSLMPFIHNPEQDKERFVFCEAISQTSIRSIQLKYIENKNNKVKPELFLYERDPFEKSNKANENAALCKDLAKKIQLFKKQCEDFREKLQPQKQNQTVNLDRKDLDKLKALGYIE